MEDKLESFNLFISHGNTYTNAGSMEIIVAITLLDKKLPLLRVHKTVNASQVKKDIFLS